MLSVFYSSASVLSVCPHLSGARRRCECRQKERAAKRKEAEKAARREAQVVKRVVVKERLDSMTEEERAAWREVRAARQADRRGERGAKHAKMQAALEGGQRIVLDLEFAHLMTPTEQRSMCHQLSYCYSANTRSERPAHLVFAGLGGGMGEMLRRQISGFDNWQITATDKPYVEHFKASLDELVYLTADSPNELQAIDPGKVYIVGRNRHKNICFNKAVEQGVATARLPIGAYMQLASSQVLCTNHVVEIMLQWGLLKDWAEAFSKVIPTRKRKADGAAAAAAAEEDDTEACASGEAAPGAGTGEVDARGLPVAAAAEEATV